MIPFYIAVLWMSAQVKIATDFSCPPDTCVTFSSTTAERKPIDHGKLLSTQIACIKAYTDGTIEYLPCEISTPPITNFVKPVASDIKPEFAEAAQRAADETDGKPPKCVFDRKNNAGSNCYCEAADKCRDYTAQEWAEFNRIMAEPAEPAKPAEPVDVPAVQVDYISHRKGEPLDCGLNWCVAPEDIHDKRPGCADKARILEHDENSPPKYWCRKVQP